ncbi:class I SAM-dependent methyltransferase [Sphaerisporangium sp. NPDC049002]|uniref:class I SAM-dependent methyltransferase n=1 Tax=unclassified Sphaerisporangium TaxID=2630420 RepID=UPI00340F8C91
MVDATLGHPRLAAIYDPLDPDRSDLDAYLAMAEEFGARSVLDIGCGTGVFALLLAERGREEWAEWTRETTYRMTDIPGVGHIETWAELRDVSLPLVSFRGTHVFTADEDVLTSESTLRFRERTEIERDLHEHGFVVEDVRDAPDRPGKEFVFVARRGTAKPVLPGMP